MKTAQVVALLVIVAFAPGCFLSKRINNTMMSWQGHHASELLMSWGPPQQVFDDGSGGRLLVWTLDRTYTTPAKATTTTTASATYWNDYLFGAARSYTTYTPARVQGYTAYRMFHVDSRGTIVSWSWRGL